MHNEGKLHIGYVYAADPDARTHQQMARGSLCFLAMLAELTGADAGAFRKSLPFTYGISAASRLSVAQIETHFNAVDRTIQALEEALPLAAAEGGIYAASMLSERAFRETFNPETIQAALQEFSSSSPAAGGLPSRSPLRSRWRGPLAGSLRAPRSGASSQLGLSLEPRFGGNHPRLGIIVMPP